MFKAATYSWCFEISDRPSIYDKPGYIHDLAYRDLGVSGLNGLFNEKRAIKADYTFVAHNLALTYNPTINPVLRARAYLLGIVLGLIALPKTIENYSSSPRGKHEQLLADLIHMHVNRRFPEHARVREAQLY